MNETSGKPEETTGSLPPRRTKHPSERGRWLRAFYLTLVLMFVGLTVGLMLWGRHTAISP